MEIVWKPNEATENPETVSLSQLKSIEKKLELCYSEYSVKHDSIMLQCPTESVEDQDKMLDVCDALVKLNLLVDFFRVEPANNEALQVIVTQPHLRTPSPTFDGLAEVPGPFQRLVW